MPAKKKASGKKKAQKATSNVFAMFEQSQIQEFKEAFNMIDQVRALSSYKQLHFLFRFNKKI